MLPPIPIMKSDRISNEGEKAARNEPMETTSMPSLNRVEFVKRSERLPMGVCRTPRQKGIIELRRPAEPKDRPYSTIMSGRTEGRRKTVPSFMK